MYDHHNLHFSAWSLLGRTVWLIHQPSHFSFTTAFLFADLTIAHLLCNCKHSLLSFHHSVGPRFLPTATAVDYIFS